MAHEVEMVNGIGQMAYAGQTPWHGLGTVLDESDVYDWRKTCAKSGLRRSNGSSLFLMPRKRRCTLPDHFGGEVGFGSWRR